MDYASKYKSNKTASCLLQSQTLLFTCHATKGRAIKAQKKIRWTQPQTVYKHYVIDKDVDSKAIPFKGKF